MRINIDNRWRRTMILYSTVPWAGGKLFWEAGPRDIINVLKDAHVDVVYIEVKGMYGQVVFSSREGVRSAQFPDDSFIKDFIEIAHENNIGIGAYYVVGWENTSGKVNPDWLARSASGETYSWDHYPLDILCTNTPYRDAVLTQVRELVTQYDFDVLWLDAIQYETPDRNKGPACYCSYCKKKFLRKFGAEIPTEDWSNPLWRKFVRWKQDTITRMFQDIKEVSAMHNPDVRIISNLCGCLPGFPWSISQNTDEVGQWCDHIMLESQTEREGFNASSFVPRLGRAIGKGKPVEVGFARVPNGIDNALRRKANLKWQIFTAVANGAAPFIWDMVNPDGTIEAEVYARLGEAFREVRQREELLGGEPMKYAAVCYSQNTRDFYGWHDTEKYAQSVFGAAKALTMYTPHLPWEVVTDRSLCDLDELLSHKVLVLPNTACLSNVQVATVREYVKRGGGLVATYQTSMFDEEGVSREEFALPDVFGCRYHEAFETNAVFLEPIAGSPTVSDDWNYAQMHRGEFLKVKYDKDCSIDAWVRRSFSENLFSKTRYYAGLEATLGERTQYPGIVRHRYGEGKVVYVPGLVATNFSELSYEAFGQLIVDSVLWAASEEPQILIEAPSIVHVSHFTKGNQYVVHLVSFHCEPLKRGDPITLIEGIEVSGVQIRTRAKITGAQMISTGQKLQAKTGPGGETIVNLPPIGLWETIVLTRK